MSPGRGEREHEGEGGQHCEGPPRCSARRSTRAALRARDITNAKPHSSVSLTYEVNMNHWQYSQPPLPASGGNRWLWAAIACLAVGQLGTCAGCAGSAMGPSTADALRSAEDAKDVATKASHRAAEAERDAERANSRAAEAESDVKKIRRSCSCARSE